MIEQKKVYKLLNLIEPSLVPIEGKHKTKNDFNL